MAKGGTSVPYVTLDGDKQTGSQPLIEQSFGLSIDLSVALPVALRTTQRTPLYSAPVESSKCAFPALFALSNDMYAAHAWVLAL